MQIAADRSNGEVATIDKKQDDLNELDSANNARLLVGGMRLYRPPAKGLPLESHLKKHYPEVAEMRSKLLELNAQRASWVGSQGCQLETRCSAWTNGTW